MKKIISIKAEDWEKALSYDTETFTNGIFKVFSNCFPFLRKGNIQPVLASTLLGSGTINPAKVIRTILPVYTSALPQFYVWADDGKVYLTDASNIADISAQIIQGSAILREAGIFQNQIIYATNTGVRSNVIPLNSASDIQILNGLSSNPHPFVVGADRNGYIGNGNNVAKITNLAATTNNSTAVAVSLETGYIVRKLINDGRYLVWLADNATANNNYSLKFSCIVAYWDLAKSVFDQIYEFQDSYIAGAELIGDVIKIVTPSGIYVTNFATRPKLIVPFRLTAHGSTILSSEVPIDFHATTNYKQNFLLWGSAGTTAIYGFGNAIFGLPDRLFQYLTSTGTNLSALATDNNVILAATGAAGSVALYVLNNDSNNTTMVANVAGITLEKPFTFHHARVILRSPITSGASVSLKLLNGAVSTSTGTKTIKASETKTNSTDSGEKNLIFDHTSAGDGTDVKAFDEITDIELTTNVAIKSLEIWGDEVDERSSYG